MPTTRSPADVELARLKISEHVAWYMLEHYQPDDDSLGLPEPPIREQRFECDLVIVSGGVAWLDDLRRAADAGLAGAIVGRALHERRFTLAEALACVAA